MSIDVLPKKEIIRLSLDARPSKLISACGQMMLDTMPALIFEDKKLQSILTAAERTAHFATPEELDNFYDELTAERLGENTKKLAEIFSALPDSRGQRYLMDPSEAEGYFFAVETGDPDVLSDLGMHVDGHQKDTAVMIAVNTMLAGSADMSVGFAVWQPEKKKYADIPTETFRTEPLGLGSIACFVLGGPEAIRPAAHDFVTTSVGGRILCQQSLLGIPNA